MEPVSFIVATNNDEVLKQNICASPDVDLSNHELLEMRGYSRPGEAYNAGIAKAKNDVLVFVHQDVYLPGGWLNRLFEIIATIERFDEKWGVLGCFGVSLAGEPVGHVFSNGLQAELGAPGQPAQVQSLDELLLVLRRSSGLHFRKELPGYHMYGTEICLLAKKKNMNCYAISNFCVHNSSPIKILKQDFWECVQYIRSQYRDELPMKALCSPLYKSGMRMKLYKVKYLFKKKIQKMKGILKQVIKNRENNSIQRHPNPGSILPLNK